MRKVVAGGYDARKTKELVKRGGLSEMTKRDRGWRGEERGSVYMSGLNPVQVRDV